MVEQIKDKDSLITFLNKKLAERNDLNKKDTQDLQQMNRINLHMGNVCGLKCLNDIQSKTLNPKEELCLTECAKSYFDNLEKGEKMYESISQSYRL